MRDVSEHMKVPTHPLCSWHEKVRADSDWRHSPEHFSSNAKAFLPEVEATLGVFIRLYFVSQGCALMRPTLRPLLLLLVQGLAAEWVLELQALDFKGLYHFMSTFLKRVDLSFRRARAQWLPILGDEECAHFMANMITAYHRHPPHLIINFGESNWHLVMVGD
jgi:hypothetical protein